MDAADPGPSLRLDRSAVPADASSPARPTIDIVSRAAAWQDAGLDEATLRRAATAALAAAASAPAAELAIVLSDDHEVRELNRAWRGKDAPTNVLAFPLDAPRTGSNEAHPLGDVILAYQTVAAEADQKSTTLTQHAARLVVHGVLHLLGFDHEDDAEAEEMEALEDRILASLGVAP